MILPSAIPVWPLSWINCENCLDFWFPRGLRHPSIPSLWTSLFKHTVRRAMMFLQSPAPFSHFLCSLYLGSNRWKYANKILMSYYFHIPIIRWGDNGYHFCLLLWLSSPPSPLYFSTKLWTFLNLYPEFSCYLEYFPCSYLPEDKSLRAQFWWLV